jgi:hypothetical protein
MQVQIINATASALRMQMIRGDLDGSAHVEALLVVRGLDMPDVLPAQRIDAARRGQMAVFVPSALRSGAKTQATVVAAYASAKRPELTPEAAYKRASMLFGEVSAQGAGAA